MSDFSYNRLLTSTFPWNMTNLILTSCNTWAHSAPPPPPPWEVPLEVPPSLPSSDVMEDTTRQSDPTSRSGAVLEMASAVIKTSSGMVKRCS